MPYNLHHIYPILLISIVIGSQIAVYKVVSVYLTGSGTKIKLKRSYLLIFLALVNLPLPFIYFTPSLFYHGFLRKFVMWPFYAYETLSIAILIVVLIAIPVKLLVRFFVQMGKGKIGHTMETSPSQSRRAFIKTTTLGVGAYTFAGSLHSIYTREEYKIDKVKLPSKNLPPQLEGLTIAMISDIHVGMYMLEDDMLKYTEAINNLKPDMIFIPGDFITSKTEEIFPFVKAFSGLKSKHGIYTCLGNHDYFGDPNIITEKVRDAGMKVLRNQTDELEINGGKLILSGVDDGSHANFKKVSYEASSLNTTRILLCHKPYYFETAVAGKFDFMLSGHTHGGQVVLLDFLGMKLTPAALVSQYVAGKYRRGDSIMYVSRGIGTVGLPVRVNCPPEITLFTLTANYH
jgi:predicted MPP superfamily phosphohydrolase